MEAHCLERQGKIINIDDVIDKIDIPEGHVIRTIFKQQKQLMIKYDVIERKNGFQVPEPPYNINSHLVQHRLKDMFWRVAEELAEAVEVLPRVEVKLQDWPKHWSTNANIRHFFEEIADAMHFLVEASIIADMCVEDVVSVFNLLPYNKFKKEVSLQGTRVIRGACASIIFQLGLTANLLKNKPWKCTQMETDTANFNKMMKKTWQYFTMLCGHLACSQKYVYVLYAKKNLVNQWRQKTNY